MERFSFLSFEGLNELQVTDLKDLLNFETPADKVEFPWSSPAKDALSMKGEVCSWNVHAPVFESAVLKSSIFPFDTLHKNESCTSVPSRNLEFKGIYLHTCQNTLSNVPESLKNNGVPFNSSDCGIKSLLSSSIQNKTAHLIAPSANSQHNAFDIKSSSTASEITVKLTIPSQNSQIGFTQGTSQVRLNPSASSFVPQSCHSSLTNGMKHEFPANSGSPILQNCESIHCSSSEEIDENSAPSSIEQHKDTVPDSQVEFEKSDLVVKDSFVDVSVTPSRSWADVLKTGPFENQNKSNNSKALVEADKISDLKHGETAKSVISGDKLALILGKYIYDLKLDFQPVFLQPRGLINSRNWCYINATLQVLFACSPFYTLLRNLPIGIGVDRGKSSTPVIDSMVKVAYEFVSYSTFQEDIQPGVPFQPKHFYDMLGDLKSDCLKGQQEDAEEFLSYILNGMHEEMVTLIKNYEKGQVNGDPDSNLNGCASDSEDDWQVIRTKQKRMITRKVAEHKTPISELLGGQIKSVLTISGSKPSASVQPFFTLKLDIQSESISSVNEALDQMTVREPIQGYTCCKTKQELEAYSRIALQKLPPILILHLKRFVYNKNGGCKKVMKKTEYPIKLELKRDLFSSDVKRSHRSLSYTLFAVMYHDGEEAAKGHYVADIYNRTLGSWIRCDDRSLANVAEEQVLSHTPPRVPYLLFYQDTDKNK